MTPLLKRSPSFGTIFPRKTILTQVENGSYTGHCLTDGNWQPVQIATTDHDLACLTERANGSMKNSTIHTEESHKLRQKAERLLDQANDEAQDLAGMPPQEAAKLVHELRVHQLELKMQNDELRGIQAELEKARDRYVHLYDFAPTAYLTVDEKGAVAEANLTAATLLERPRSALVGTMFSRFVHRDDQDVWYLHRKRLLETGDLQAFQLRLVKNDDGVFYVNLECMLVEESQRGLKAIRISATDITGLKRAEEKLRQSEEKYRALFESLDAGYCVIEMRIEPDQPLDYKFIEVNKAFERQSTLTNAKGKWMRDLRPNHEESWFEIYRDVALTGQPVWLEHFGRELNNRWFAVNAFRIGPAQQRRVAVLFYNITERKQAEEALRESGARFRMAADAAKIGVFSRDLQTGEDYWSPEFLAIYGYGPNDQFPLRDGIPTAVHPEDLQKILKERDKLYQHPMSDFYSEHRIILPDGQVRWVMVRGRNDLDVNGKLLRTHGLAMDITERKQAEEALARSLAKAEEGERTLDALMEYVPEGITIADAPDVRIRRVSRYGVELTGKPKEELIGIPAEQHTHKWDLYEADGRTVAKDDDLPLTRATKYGEIVRDKEHVLGHPDGRRIPILCNAAPIRDQNGTVTGGIIAWRDITERKKAEEELRHWSETLEKRVAERTELAESRARKLQALAGELIGTEERERRRIAQLLHEDLQQIIAAARFQLQSFGQDLPPEPTLMSIEKLLEESIAKSRRITDELSPPVLEHSDLLSALKWLVRHMSEQFGLQVELELDTGQQFDSEPIKIFIFRATQELLFNAYKHSGVKSAKVELSCQNDLCILTVSDQGRGFNPELVDSAVVRDGFGLLSLRERASYVGGNFLIESAPGQGSRFILSIPANLIQTETQESPADKLPNQASCVETATSMCIRVLIADAHKVMRQGLVKMLSRQPNIEIVGEAANGGEVIELARQIKPDVILMDPSMPDMDGIQTTRFIKAELPNVGVVGLSMFADEQYNSLMREAGAEAFTSKSGSLAELLEAIYGASRKSLLR